MMWYEYRREVIALLCVLALVPVAFAAGNFFNEWRAQGGHLIEGYAAENPCPGERGETSSCWTGYYTAFVAKYPAKDALADLKARYEDGGGAKTFCHPLLHIIGEKAGKEYGSVAEAYKHGETFCRSGYHHGVLEGLFGEDGDKLITQLDSLCAAVPGKERYSYDYFSCVHGIGHGLMAFFSHNLFESIAACERLSGGWEQITCSGGVFMENVISDVPEDPSRFLKADDLHYPCNAVPEAYRSQCYLMQTSYMLKVLGGDFEKAFAACRDAGADGVSCFQSLGRDASGWSYGSIDAAVAYCAYGGNADERTQCLLGAAADFIQSYGEVAARALCATGEDGARVPCIELVEWQVSKM